MNTDPQILDKLHTFLLREVDLRGDYSQILEDESLIKSGLVDSLSIAQLIAFIESEFQIQFDLDDLVAENFETLERIALLVTSRAGGR